MYPDYQTVAWLIFILLFFAVPVLVFTVMICFTKHSKMSLALAAASPLIVGPTFGLFQEYREKIELQKFGVVSYATVDSRKVVTSRSGKRHWMIKCKFKINGKFYETGYHEDFNNIFKVNDTIKIVYSQNFPKIYELKDLE